MGQVLASRRVYRTTLALSGGAVRDMLAMVVTNASDAPVELGWVWFEFVDSECECPTVQCSSGSVPFAEGYIEGKYLIEVDGRQILLDPGAQVVVGCSVLRPNLLSTGPRQLSLGDPFGRCNAGELDYVVVFDRGWRYSLVATPEQGLVRFSHGCRWHGAPSESKNTPFHVTAQSSVPRRELSHRYRSLHNIPILKHILRIGLGNHDGEEAPWVIGRVLAASRLSGADGLAFLRAISVAYDERHPPVDELLTATDRRLLVELDRPSPQCDSAVSYGLPALINVRLDMSVKQDTKIEGDGNAVTNTATSSSTHEQRTIVMAFVAIVAGLAIAYGASLYFVEPTTGLELSVAPGSEVP